MQKKNSKLESFLFRKLPEHRYERIRGYESCIVVSERENKAFKYVILGDEWIYLTENPPKTIQESVALGDVISVELVNDFPDFLLGDDKVNSQHLVITYWTSEPVKRRSFRKKKSPRGSLSDLHGDRSNASTPLSMASSHDLWSEDYGYASLSSLQHNRPDSRGSVSSNREVRKGNLPKKKKKGTKTLHTIQSENEETFLKSLKEELEEDILEDIENQSELGESVSKSHDLHNSKNTTRSMKSARSARSSRPLPESPMPNTQAFQKTNNQTNRNPVISTNGLPKKKGMSPEPPPDDSEESSCCIKCCSFSFGKSRVSPFCGSRKAASPTDENRLFSASTVSAKKPVMSEVHIEVSSVDNDGQVFTKSHRPRVPSLSSSITTLRGHDRSGTPIQDDFERRSVLSMASMSDFGGSTNRLSLVGAEGIPEKRRAVLNLYLLSSVSPMLMLIRSAWSNCLLSSTLMLNPECLETPKGSILRASQRGKQEQLFNELKRDLMKPDNEMDDLYYLLNELKLATEKNFSLKRLFWKTADLFHFCVKTLQHFLPKSPDSKDSEKRTEEFEFVSLLIEILGMMFHESEIIKERTAALKSERGRSVVGLLMVLTCNPDMPDKTKGVDSKKILTDFTKTALSTVFELFLMAKQANWSFIEGNFYNISWMVSTLEEIQHTEKFVARTIDMVLEMISPSSSEKLSPTEAVLLYQQFFILETFLQYSPKVKTFICSTYTEEFKYFVQPPVIMKKLPQMFPVYHILIAQIEEVVKKVIPSKTTGKEK
ncbi:uncharacterized protein C12orf56-like [Ruditapes philippinarum]|uniref:uncharacterized protein C12orf56-like n=1 Tax=Ruditapes philippinarum TaxID=129788 RepID=UPI00295AC0B7|nr:uncharacterized protein C12orf56-like [Ruditapes philippinarum]